MEQGKICKGCRKYGIREGCYAGCHKATEEGTIIAGLNHQSGNVNPFDLGTPPVPGYKITNASTSILAPDNMECKGNCKDKTCKNFGVCTEYCNDNHLAPTESLKGWDWATEFDKKILPFFDENDEADFVIKLKSFILKVQETAYREGQKEAEGWGYEGGLEKGMKIARQALLKEIKEEIVKMKKEYWNVGKYCNSCEVQEGSMHTDSCTRLRIAGYNSALSDVETLIFKMNMDQKEIKNPILCKECSGTEK